MRPSFFTLYRITGAQRLRDPCRHELDFQKFILATELYTSPLSWPCRTKYSLFFLLHQLLSLIMFSEPWHSFFLVSEEEREGLILGFIFFHVGHIRDFTSLAPTFPATPAYPSSLGPLSCGKAPA